MAVLYLENYGCYAELAKNGFTEIYINDELTKDNWHDHVLWITNINRDAIEEDAIQMAKIRVLFDDCNLDNYVELSIFDYWTNLTLWYMFLCVGERLTPYHVYFPMNGFNGNEYDPHGFLTRNNMKDYIDEKFIDRYTQYIPNIRMNKIIDECMSKYNEIDDFKFYLANTTTLVDFIDLMNENQEVYDAMHCSLSDLPIEDVKNVGMEYMNVVNNYIKISKKHCFRDAVGCGEAISDKQEKESFINIGSKPNGLGGAYPFIIDRSFVNGGVCDIPSMYIDSSAGRIAQIINKTNVGTSGQFARLLSLNNRDTFLNPDPNYSCKSHNYQVVEVKNAKILQRLATGRYYRLHPNGEEFRLTRKDTHIIGKTIYLRSPMTCESNSSGHGICYKCYGDLAYHNRDFNIGQLASELLSSKLTQKLLSAKHLFESKIQKVVWTSNFTKYFDMEQNTVKFAENFNPKKFKLLLNPDAIDIDEEDDTTYPTISSFDVLDPAGEINTITTENGLPICLLDNICKYINNPSYEEDYDIGSRITIPMDKLVDDDDILFGIDLVNDDLSKTLDMIKALINKKSETVENNDRHSILQKLIETTIDGGINVASVHLEVILANQIRDTEDILSLPNWIFDNAPYQLITLDRALTDNPSVTISLEYQKIAKAFYYPLTFKKTKPSSADMFFVEQPQKFIQNRELISDDVVSEEGAVTKQEEIVTLKE